MPTGAEEPEGKPPRDDAVEPEAVEPEPKPKPKPKKRRRRTQPRTIDHDVPAIIEPITRSPQAGALALAAAAWIGSLVPTVHEKLRGYLSAAGGLLGVLALYLQRVASIRAEARKEAARKAAARKRAAEDDENGDDDEE